MNNVPCFLIPAIVGVVCGILGYLLGRIFSDKDGYSNELTLQAQLDACLANSRSMAQKIDAYDNSNGPIAPIDKSTQNFVTVSTPSENVSKKEAVSEKSFYDTKKVSEIMGKKWKQDDLKIVEGIGPKIEEVFHAAGIKTWEALAQTPTKKLQEILTTAGDKYKMHNPESWSKQAKMAYEGKWSALKKWQIEHKGGKE